jgi:hypothetical protein
MDFSVLLTLTNQVMLKWMMLSVTGKASALKHPTIRAWKSFLLM